MSLTPFHWVGLPNMGQSLLAASSSPDSLADFVPDTVAARVWNTGVLHRVSKFRKRFYCAISIEFQ